MTISFIYSASEVLERRCDVQYFTPRMFLFYIIRTIAERGSSDSVRTTEDCVSCSAEQLKIACLVLYIQSQGHYIKMDAISGLSSFDLLLLQTWIDQTWIASLLPRAMVVGPPPDGSFGFPGSWDGLVKRTL